jgi:LmbE family N-acetylglucosaminyl deacetylase
MLWREEEAVLMEHSTAVLVLVAHPNDETIGFSTVCAGADVVSVTDGGWGGRAAARADSFQQACARLGARGTLLLNLPDIFPWRLPVEVLVERIQALGPYRRIYTHSPFEVHPHHRDVVLAASRCFEEIWVRSLGGYAAEAHVLDRQAFQRKIDILNTIYRHELTLSDEDPPRAVAEMLDNIAGVESFVPTRWPEVVQALALTSQEMPADLPNVWAFEVSAYELERYNRTCEVLAQACQAPPPASILELGACEGAMTRRLRHLFPSADICAVESHPSFVRRLREHLSQDRRVKVVEASICDIPLAADLIVMAEVLSYVPEQVITVLSRLRASYLLTSYRGTFDMCVRQSLHAFGWRESISSEVLPKFEPVDGRDSLLIAQRPGTQSRLWRPA